VAIDPPPPANESKDVASLLAHTPLVYDASLALTESRHTGLLHAQYLPASCSIPEFTKLSSEIDMWRVWHHPPIVVDELVLCLNPRRCSASHHQEVHQQSKACLRAGSSRCASSAWVAAASTSTALGRYTTGENATDGSSAQGLVSRSVWRACGMATLRARRCRWVLRLPDGHHNTGTRSIVCSRSRHS
jgi:hypothetical protein